MVVKMEGKRRGGVMVDREESEDVSKDEGEESGNNGREKTTILCKLIFFPPTTRL